MQSTYWKKDSGVGEISGLTVREVKLMQITC